MGKEYSFIGFPALHCLGGLSGSSTAPSGVSLNEVWSMLASDMGVSVHKALPPWRLHREFY